MIPTHILHEIDALVREGYAPTREAAIEDALRIGIAAIRARATPRTPPRPAPPPGVNEPHDDRPISVDPTDVNWAP